jgi:hypothetical protein
MPGIQSPGKVLSQWKKDKDDFLKEGGLSKQSKVHSEREPKVFEHLKILANIAKKEEKARLAEKETFEITKAKVDRQINKIRLSYVKQKGDKVVGKYFRKLGKLVLVVKGLNLDELDPNEKVSYADIEVLNELNESTLGETVEEESKEEHVEEVDEKKGKEKVVEPATATAQNKATAWATFTKKAPGDRPAGTLPFETKQAKRDHEARLKKLLPAALEVQNATVIGGDVLIHKNLIRKLVDTAVGHARSSGFDDAQEALDELEQALPVARKVIAIQERANGITGPVSGATGALNQLSGDALKNLRATPGFAKSDGLKKLARQVEEIDKAVKAVEEERSRRERSGEKPASFRAAYDDILRKVNGTVQECEGYMKEHGDKSGQDERWQAARALRDTLMPIPDALLDFYNELSNLRRKATSPTKPPSYNDLLLLNSISVATNLPPELKHEAVGILAEARARVTEPILDKPTVTNLLEFDDAMPVAQSEILIKDLVARHGNNPAVLVPLCKSLVSIEVANSLRQKDQPLRANGFVPKLLTAYGGVRAVATVQRTVQASKAAVKDVKVVPSMKPSVLAKQVGFENDPDSKRLAEKLKSTPTFEQFQGAYPDHPLIKKIEKLQAENQAVLTGLATTLLDSFTADETLKTIPPDIAQVCSDIFAEAQQRYPLDVGSEEEKATNKAECLSLVGGFLLLRLVNPAITKAITPKNDEELAQQRTLVLAGKFLQNASNGKPFKEAEMQVFNDLIQTKYAAMMTALEKVVARGRRAARGAPEPGEEKTLKGVNEDLLGMLEEALRKDELDHVSGWLTEMGVGKDQADAFVQLIEKLKVIWRDSTQEKAKGVLLISLMNATNRMRDDRLRDVLNAYLGKTFRG